MDHDLPPQRVLEMSTAHGAMLEVLRHFGHDVIGIDYANMASSAGNQSSAAHRDLNDENFTRTRDDYGIEITEDQRSRPEWPYRKITESIDLPMRIFDAGKTPYPCTDKEFDVLLCFQAMGRYCHPKDWSSLIDEFTRITRKTIVILLNPVRDPENTPQEYLKAYQDAKLDLRRYRRNRFACVSTFMHWGQAAGFKLTAT